nr:uncharacterized protein LOC117275716 [Nicotiana tomentosiformis]
MVNRSSLDMEERLKQLPSGVTAPARFGPQVRSRKSGQEGHKCDFWWGSTETAYAVISPQKRDCTCGREGAEAERATGGISAEADHLPHLRNRRSGQVTAGAKIAGQRRIFINGTWPIFLPYFTWWRRFWRALRRDFLQATQVWSVGHRFEWLKSLGSRLWNFGAK